MKRHSETKFTAALLVLLVLAFLPNALHAASAASPSSTGVLVPLYAYPGDTWTGLIQQAQAYPTVPVVAVINPANGPGYYSDPNFVSGIANLQSAGISVLGYVHTSYATIPLSTVESQIYDYLSWYHVNGIYIDEMTNVPGYEWYYSDLTSYAKSIGASVVFGNPGADVPASYIGTVDTIVIYENAGLPSISFLGGWHTAYPKSNFAIVSYADWWDQSYEESAIPYLGYISMTDGQYPNPYSVLPSFLGNELATAAGADPAPSSGGSTGSTGSAGSGGASIVINSVDQYGNAISGYYSAIQSSSGSASGFTPATFSTTPGVTYSVLMGNYGSCTFSHWQYSGSSSNPTYFTAGGSQSLTAVYDCGSSSGGSSTTTINVSTVLAGGSPLSGLYISLWQNGAVVGTCFSSCSFTVQNGQTYSLSAGSFGGDTFSYWQGDGSTGFENVYVPSSSTTLWYTAVYN